MFIFLVAKLLYNSLCPSVSQSVMLWGKRAPIKDRQLKFLVNIPMTYANLMYVLSICLLFGVLDRFLDV